MGYVVAIVVNIAIAYVANNIEDWDIAPFLTDDFGRVLPMVNLSLGVAIAVNALRIIHDGRRFLALSEILTLAFSLAATVRVWSVFPFDFDDYSDLWEPLARFVLVVAMVGPAIAMVVQLTRLVTGRPSTRDDQL